MKVTLQFDFSVAPEKAHYNKMMMASNYLSALRYLEEAIFKLQENEADEIKIFDLKNLFYDTLNDNGVEL